MVRYINMYNKLWTRFFLVSEFMKNYNVEHETEWKHMYIETLGNWKTIDVQRCEENYQTLLNNFLGGKINEKQFHEKFKLVNTDRFSV